MNECPYCQATDQQVKAGRTEAGSQHYKCNHCQRKYTPDPKLAGYSDEVRQQAVRLYVDGMNFRRIGRQLGVHHQTVINWINAHIAMLPDVPPIPDEVVVVEQDELYTFIGDKKRSLHPDAGRTRHQLYCRLGSQCQVR